jgi:hypothetical protein
VLFSFPARWWSRDSNWSRKGDMSDGPKSAYEIALEKLKKRDRERGEAGPAPMSEKQKREIAEIRSKCDAQLAEKEILFNAERASSLADPEALEKRRGTS